MSECNHIMAISSQQIDEDTIAVTYTCDTCGREIIEYESFKIRRRSKEVLFHAICERNPNKLKDQLSTMFTTKEDFLSDANVLC